MAFCIASMARDFDETLRACGAKMYIRRKKPALPEVAGEKSKQSLRSSVLHGHPAIHVMS